MRREGTDQCISMREDHGTQFHCFGSTAVKRGLNVGILCLGSCKGVGPSMVAPAPGDSSTAAGPAMTDRQPRACFDRRHTTQIISTAPRETAGKKQIIIDFPHKKCSNDTSGASGTTVMDTNTINDHYLPEEKMFKCFPAGLRQTKILGKKGKNSNPNGRNNY